MVFVSVLLMIWLTTVRHETAHWLALRRIPRTSRLWLPLFLVGAVSPLIDLAYNYQGGFWRVGTDVHDLFLALPDLIVHGFFLVTIVLGSIAAHRLLVTTGGAKTRSN